MLQPKRTKYRRVQKGRTTGVAQRGASVSFGDFGIKTLEAGWITSRQIEAARIAMTRRMKRVGKVWIRIFPDKPITRKPAETRMGSGKGAPEGFVAPVKPGRVLFEVGGVTEELAREAMALAMQKLPVKTKFVIRPEFHTVAPTAAQLGGVEQAADEKSPAAQAPAKPRPVAPASEASPDADDVVVEASADIAEPEAEPAVAEEAPVSDEAPTAEDEA